ncbi:hypothetical protein [Nakamurella endophytica]|uniref:Uncharacterized protein n=1 Tax=Nakamurella endophytica TaxID=1748367 RepID=A0A917WM09_9ACTN|nr:hypothetical protein [Nakamurella endophytica]GGM14149.1 hypothetical protein GCM10011594_37710 [Nakamurella endophytica]
MSTGTIELIGGSWDGRLVPVPESHLAEEPPYLVELPAGDGDTGHTASYLVTRRSDGRLQGRPTEIPLDPSGESTPADG